jgi:hypothetical protein
MRGYGRELKGGIKAGSEDLAWHLEVGGRAKFYYLQKVGFTYGQKCSQITKCHECKV